MPNDPPHLTLYLLMEVLYLVEVSMVDLFKPSIQDDWTVSLSTAVGL